MEITEPEKPEDIVIYTNRRGIMPMLIISIICSIAFLLFIVLISISLIVYPEQRNGGTIFVLIEMLGFGIMCFWLIRSLIGLSMPGTPMLVISREGIRVGTKTYGSTEFVLLWEEIEAIYTRGNIFCVRPTNKKRLLSRFHPIKRLLLRATFPKDIYVTQSYLGKPVLEVFGELQEKYAYELNKQEIQLYP
ncbi:MAG TPA: hypothetical protein VEU97_13245 [Ktedonobacteraceae bacterium]|nr:hypothetical protein [Ktedonobacteraceae bacterium]